MCREFELGGIPFDRQVLLSIDYKGLKLENVYRLDVVVDGRVVLEIKAIEKLLAIHEAQLLTYLKFSGLKTGLLLNFSAPTLKDGIKRMIR